MTPEELRAKLLELNNGKTESYFGAAPGVDYGSIDRYIAEYNGWAPPTTTPAVTETAPDWSGQEMSDYYTQLAHGLASYTQGRADLEAQGVASTASASERLRQQLIQFGIIPEGFQDKYGWVNDETRQLAQKNTETGVSTYARLQKAYADATRRAAKIRAARGMARSGETGYAIEEGNLLNRQNLSDATGKLLDANRNVYDQYTADFNDRARAFRDLETNSFNAVSGFAMPPRPSAPTAPAAPPVAPTPTSMPSDPTLATYVNPAIRRFGHTDIF